MDCSFARQCWGMVGTAAAMAGIAALSAVLTPASAATPMQKPMRWMVTFQADSRTATGGTAVTPRDAQRAAAAGLGFEQLRDIAPNTQVVQMAAGTSATDIEIRLATLRAHPAVLAVEPDYRVSHHAVLPPKDTGFSDTRYTGSAQAIGQWYLKANTGEVKSAINALGAWSHTVGDSSVVVAVLDTGILFEHPDLMRVAKGGKLLPGYDFVSGNGEDLFIATNDGDGWDADASDPGDWVDQALLDTNPVGLAGCDTQSSSWHGTRTAGLIGAISQNDQGIAGVDWGARLLPVRVLGRCGGATSDIVAGIRWAAGLPVVGVPDNPNPARVINLSLGHEGACSRAEQTAINEVIARGVVVVASAGNHQGAVESPGNCLGVIAVAGLRHIGTKVGFSSLGAEVAISAPAGNCINVGVGEPCLYSIDTTTNAGEKSPTEHTYTSQIDSNVGTSFAAPLVAGVASLLLSLNPRLTPAQVKAALQDSANPFPSDPSLPTCPTLATGDHNTGQCNCTTTQCGAGMLNALAAVQRVNPANCFFSWAERTVPTWLPTGSSTQTLDIYQYRYYPSVESYLGIAADTGHVLYVNSAGLRDLGPRSTWFTESKCL